MHRIRLVTLALALLTGLAAAPAAAAFPGDWAIGGAFERTTAPSFQDGFVADDVDRVDVAFDNRVKTLSVQLRFFGAPTRGRIDVDLGRGLPDGSCSADVASVRITATDLVVTRSEATTERFRVPEQHRWTVSSAWPGPGFSYLGWDAWRGRHHWLRAGYWDARTVTREIVEPDPHAHARSAVLELGGVAGALEDTTRVGHADTQMAWTFGHPLLDGLAVDCLEIHVPGRLAPFVIAPAPAPVPAPAPDPAAPTGEHEAIDPAEPSVTAIRRRSAIELRLAGDAERVQVRVRHQSRTLAFRSRIVLRGRAAAARSLVVRVWDGAAWSEWRRVPVRRSGSEAVRKR